MPATPSNLLDLRTAASDYKETERPKVRLAQLKKSRSPFFLTAADLDPVFQWKLGNQYGRVKARLSENTDSAYQIVTRAAFEVRDRDNPAYEAEVRLGILSALSGVGMGGSCAILALVDPDRYCVIDFRGCRSAFDRERYSFTVKDYLRYLIHVHDLAENLSWPVQEVDLALWEYDRRTHGRAA